MKAKSPLELYQLLPRTNCKKCGEDTCLSFAVKLMDRTQELERCPDLNPDQFSKLKELIEPQIKQVIIGSPPHGLILGGKDVLFRHELKFHNKTVLAYDLWDTMDPALLESRLNLVNNFRKYYLGNPIELDALAIRCCSGDRQRYRDFISKLEDLTQKPLILCSYDPRIISGALEICAERNPLVVGANLENWSKMLELIKKHKVPIAVSGLGDLDALKSLAKTFIHHGCQIVLDPGTFPDLETSLNIFLDIRKLGIEADPELRYPLMGTPMVTYLAGIPDPASLETALGCALMARGADLLILHSAQPEYILPLITFREQLYTDPRRPSQVPAGLRALGSPDRKSPVLITANFALTYFTVENDLNSAGVSCHLLVLDTEGYCVQAAVAGGQFSAQKLKQFLESQDVASKVDHRILVIPGLAARISGEAENLTGWKVMVGPIDSGMIKDWLAEHWKPS